MFLDHGAAPSLMVTRPSQADERRPVHAATVQVGARSAVSPPLAPVETTSHRRHACVRHRCQDLPYDDEYLGSSALTIIGDRVGRNEVPNGSEDWVIWQSAASDVEDRV